MLVGRDSECARVTAVLGEVRAGRGAVLLLVGPPGVGKTALLGFAARAADGPTVLRGTGVEFEARFAWSGLHQLLQIRPQGQTVSTVLLRPPPGRRILWPSPSGSGAALSSLIVIRWRS